MVIGPALHVRIISPADHDEQELTAGRSEATCSSFSWQNSGPTRPFTCGTTNDCHGRVLVGIDAANVADFDEIWTLANGSVTITHATQGRDIMTCFLARATGGTCDN